MIADPWTYRREIDESRIRLAMAAVQWLVPESDVFWIDGEVHVRVRQPLWARLTFGLWKKHHAYRLRERCRKWVPRVCGWCPQVRVTI